jgi:excisionase family DNA binding protein
MAERKPIITADWIRVRDAAAQLGCDRKTILNRISAGTITGVRVIRIERVVRLNRADWAAYLERNAVAQEKAA